MQETIDAFNRAHSVPQTERPERGGARREEGEADEQRKVVKWE